MNNQDQNRQHWFVKLKPISLTHMILATAAIALLTALTMVGIAAYGFVMFVSINWQGLMLASFTLTVISLLMINWAEQIKNSIC